MFALLTSTQTSTDEQRNTEWKPGQSLVDYLDAGRPDQTVEGLPAPLRAVLIARKPDDQLRLRRYQL